ncbi:MAG TPA: family 43 glycosylhydrolase [Polyangia bacterium]|nr:family 43 glycosylhydrolase [Polyangia bacterium]
MTTLVLTSTFSGAIMSGCSAHPGNSSIVERRASAIIDPTAPTQAPLTVYRWQNGAGDWINVPAGGHQPSDSLMTSSGYAKNSVPQFRAYLIATQDMVPVYRWQNPAGDWRTILDGSPSDDEMEAQTYGIATKTFEFYAFPTQRPGTVPVYNWHNGSTGDYLTVADGEPFDSTGYGNQTFAGYYVFPAYNSTPPQPGQGYFALSAPDPQPTLAEDPEPPGSWENSYDATINQGSHDHEGAPHTLSVVQTYRSILGIGAHTYWGYYGVQGKGTIGLAYSDDLVNWTKAPQAASPTNPTNTQNPLIPDKNLDMKLRWPSVIYDETTTTFYMSYDYHYEDVDKHLQLRTSSDGSFKDGGSVADLTSPPSGYIDGNSHLFKDPVSGLYYLYWMRQPYDIDPESSNTAIVVKSATTPFGLVGASEKTLAWVVCSTQNPICLSAPNMLYANGSYYLAVETAEGDLASSLADPGNDSGYQWMTRVMVGNAPDGNFIEIPGNPILTNNEACMFQHVFNISGQDQMHAYICKVPDWNTGDWTIEHRTALLSDGPAVNRPGERASSTSSHGPAAYQRSDANNAVVFGDSNDHVKELSMPVGGNWYLGELSGPLGAPTTAGPVSVFVQYDGTNTVTYRTPANHIELFSLPKGSSTWTAQDVSVNATGCPPLASGVLAAGPPSGYTRSDRTSAIVYRGTDNHVYELSHPYGSSCWQIGDLNGVAGSVTAGLEPMGFVRADGDDSVVYTDASGDLREFALPLGSNTWTNESIMTPPAGWTTPPAASGSPRGYVRSDGASAVVYRSAGGHIWEISRVSGESPSSPTWYAGELTTIPDAPLTVSDPMPYIRADGQSTVVYTAGDGKIYELALPYGATSWSSNTISVSGTPTAVDGPMGYTRGDNNSAVVFHDEQGDVWQLELTIEPWVQWTVADLTGCAATPSSCPAWH